MGGDRFSVGRAGGRGQAVRRERAKGARSGAVRRGKDGLCRAQFRRLCGRYFAGRGRTDAGYAGASGRCARRRRLDARSLRLRYGGRARLWPRRDGRQGPGDRGALRHARRAGRGRRAEGRRAPDPRLRRGGGHARHEILCLEGENARLRLLSRRGISADQHRKGRHQYSAFLRVRGRGRCVSSGLFDRRGRARERCARHGARRRGHEKCERGRNEGASFRRGLQVHRDRLGR